MPGAAAYVLLGAKCGKQKRYMKVLQSSSSTFNVKKIRGSKLAPKTSYKFVIMAFDKKGNKVAVSKMVHAYTSGGKFGNVKKVKLNKKKLTLSPGKSKKLKAKVMKQKGKKLRQHRKARYESSNPAVATVNAKTGMVTAVAPGKCVIYAYGCDGKSAKCKVTVK